MTPRTDRIDRSGSRAVLIGVSEYTDRSFPPVPGAEKSLRGVHRMLVDQDLGAWPSDQVHVLEPFDCRRVMSELRRHAQNTSGVLLLYFVGHGTVTENGDLVLAMEDTVANEPDITGLEYSKIRKILSGSPAKVKAVVLDCCYSGRAIDVLSADDQHVANSTDAQGTYTLTAADRAAHAGRAGAFTAFTGELLDLIGEGVAGGPPVLTFAELYPRLRQRLIARNLPHPNQRGTDTADKYPVSRNVSGEPSTGYGHEHKPPRRHPTPGGSRIDPDTGPRPPARRSGVRTATVVTALATCLLTVPIWSAATDEAVKAGEITISEASVQMTLCGVLVAALAIGVLLVRNTSGRWLIAAGGIGLALLPGYSMFWTDGRIGIGRELLPLAAVIAALSAILGMLLPVRGVSEQRRI
ncbi:caspase domain-containing protein [Streptomyces sp. NPDC102364]|uniref:caspase family protein n=1 Tax=unclassified Streptomyces TaxID=2593676 RepID=UPI0038100B42